MGDVYEIPVIDKIEVDGNLGSREDFKMQKELRLQKKEHFQQIFKRGKSIANRQLVLYYMENQHVEAFRLGISVSKKIGHAVTRNRLKRLLKEVVRSHTDEIKEGHDLILIVRQPASEMGLEELDGSVLHLLRKANLYKKQKN
jgi:ribonuclease P protein component